MSEQTVLICGAGIAGPTLAYWLARHGFRPTVVEHATALRSSGSPVDVRGPAVDVAERMGVMPRIREARTHTTGISFVNAKGRRVGGVNMRALQQAAGSREVELPRGDLASILYQASRDHAEFLFNDSIVALDEDEHGGGVTRSNRRGGGRSKVTPTPCSSSSRATIVSLNRNSAWSRLAWYRIDARSPRGSSTSRLPAACCKARM